VAAVTPVRAAGGVLWRLDPPGSGVPSAGVPGIVAPGVGLDDGLRVAVVHRPRYDDWSLPKGKLLPKEHPLVGARREVWEETGIRTRVGVRLPSVEYPVRVGSATVRKTVDYWAMSVVGDGGRPSDSEVDRVAWLSVDAALARLSYPHDARVLTAFTSLSRPTSGVIVVRHATAGRRSGWFGPDGSRPLDRPGRATAGRLAELLECFVPGTLASAATQRCVETLEPLACRLDKHIATDTIFDESADPTLAAERILAWPAGSGPAVVCSHQGLIPGLLATLTGDPATHFRTRKGSAWVVWFADREPIRADAIRADAIRTDAR
jgi:8-oxo-dGTP pyrophosphatase MutT (NUDIX family)